MDKRKITAILLALAVAFITAVGLCVRALQAPQAVFSQAEMKMRVVVDAGHGGIDGGVTGKTTGIKESDLNLSLAMELKWALEDMGFEVVLTRKTEAGLYGTTAKGFKKRDMLKRKEIIQTAEPDMVVSLHQNFYPSKIARGGQVFYAHKNAESKLLAETLQNGLNALYAEDGAKSRNATAGEYFMLECCDVPSVIVECGFLSNPSDEKLLSSPVWKKRLAQTLAMGAVAYLSHFTS